MRTFVMRRRVEFADTDMGGIMHFSRFFVFMETAEHRFLESLGTSVALERDGKQIGWPRVAAACDYASPARFGEELEIELDVRRCGTKSMTYAFTFRSDGREIASGTMTSVCCELGGKDGVKAIPIPAAILERVEESSD